MIKEEVVLKTQYVASDDGNSMYEISRKWEGEGRKALIIELYPTISVERAKCLDTTTMHLLNHMSELGWNEIRIVNLYSRICPSKPSTKQLIPDEQNMAYIETVLEEATKDSDIVIAWGSSLSTHKTTNEEKYDLLVFMEEKGMASRVKHIVTEQLDTQSQIGTHPLYLGLHFPQEVWSLETYPIKPALKKLQELLKKQPKKKQIMRKERSSKENVSKNQG